MKTSGEIRRLLELLDGLISDRLEIFVIGGANLLAQDIIDRETMDIDVIVPPEFSKDVKVAVQEIAARELIPAKWINTMPSMDARFLSPGWKERCFLFFDGKRLRVFLLGRKDMLGLKIAAAFDRRRSDVADILAMKPTDEEWEFGRLWAREYDANPEWPARIDEMVTELRRKLRG